MNKLILIAGASASGKSRYAKHLISSLKLPVISKDSIKEVMHDGLHFNAETVDQTQYYGACAYKLLFPFAECLMKSGVDFCSIYMICKNFIINEKCLILLLYREKYDKMSKELKIRYWRDSFMANTYKVIDEKTWERSMHCMVF